MAKGKPVTSGEGGPNPPSLGQVYPAIARWASGYVDHAACTGPSDRV
jgi:hypothetical protein